MEFISTIVIVLVVLFLAYKLRIIEAGSASMGVVVDSINTGSSIADRKLKEMDSASEENHTKVMGKISAKLDDDSVTRASAKSLRAKFKALDVA